MFPSNPARQPIMRTVVRTTPVFEVLLALVVWAVVLSTLALGANGDKAAPAAEPPAADAPQDDFDQAQAEADRQAMWNSPPMVAARNWLQEYFRTSKQSPPEVEQAYMDHLAKLSAEEMRDWLSQMYAMRSSLRADQGRAASYRQWSLKQARQSQVFAQQAAQTRGPIATSAPANYVQPQAGLRAAEAAALRNRYAPLRSYQYLFLLDTLDIRDDLRALRQAQNP